MRGMVINMEEAKLRTLEEIRAFLDGTTERGGLCDADATCKKISEAFLLPVIW